MIRYFDGLKEKTSDETLVALTIELEEMVFNSYDDVNEWLDYVEDEYNEVLSQQDYLYLFDLVQTKYEVDEDE